MSQITNPKAVLQHMQPALLTTPSGTSIMVDWSHNALVSIDIAHTHIHEGVSYIASHPSIDASPIADNGLLGMLIVPPVGTHNLSFGIAVGGDAEVLLMEEPGVTTGTPIVLYNQNRKSTQTSHIRIWECEDVTATGTIIREFFAPGGSGIAAIGQSGVSNNWILAAKPYFLGLINRAGGAEPMSLTAILIDEEGAT